MRRMWETSSSVAVGLRPSPRIASSLAGPRTLEQRVLPSTIVAVFVGLLAIQIALTL